MTTEKTGRLAITFCILLAMLTATAPPTEAEDWPTYAHDPTRSGSTQETPSLPLTLSWVYTPGTPPSPAWPDPAPRDIWQRIPSLRHRVTDDAAYQVAVSESRVFFGSSSDFTIYALDAETGMPLWHFVTGGPVRYAPTVSDGRVYTGSDDGFIYCLDAATGVCIWNHLPQSGSRILPGNGRPISILPSRTGVLVEKGIAYAGFGLFPSERVEIAAFDAATGTPVWNVVPEDVSPQGYLLSSGATLYVPNGRISPTAFKLATGKLTGQFSSPHGDGGSYALITGDMLVSGPGKELVAFDRKSNERLLTFEGTRLIVRDGVYYMLTDTGITAYDRRNLMESRKRSAELIKQRTALNDSLAKAPEAVKESIRSAVVRIETRLKELRNAESLWTVYIEGGASMILTGTTLVCGGKGFLAAIDTASGSLVWKDTVDGTVRGLAFSEGRLFASTSEGSIFCYNHRDTPGPVYHRTPPASVPVSSDTATAKASVRLSDHLETDKGYCLVLPCGDGEFIAEITAATSFYVVGAARTPSEAARVRETLLSAGVYGSRCSVVVADGDTLPFTDYMMNAVMFDPGTNAGDISWLADEILRVVRPYGGKIFPRPENASMIAAALSDGRGTGNEWDLLRDGPDGSVLTRKAPDGAGEWTHQYADTANSANSGDSIVRHPVTIQWFGEPGPRFINDRHHRPMSPLFKDGRLFVIGNNHHYGIDAYNGTILWERNIPGTRRIGVIRDCGHAAVTSDILYIAAGNRCLALDALTGETLRAVPVPVRDGSGREWGYLATAGNFLYGTAVLPGAARTTLSYDTIKDGTYFDNKALVTGTALFCVDRRTGVPVWQHEAGCIINSTIAMNDTGVFFMECDASADPDNDGRVYLSDVRRPTNPRITALDPATGAPVWSRAFEMRFEHVTYASISSGKLLIVGTYNREDGLYYGLSCLDTNTGRDLWLCEYKYGDIINGDHGEQDQHPVIIGNKVYSRPYNFSMSDGSRGTFNLVRGAHGCGTISGSSYYLFGRGGNPRMYDISGSGSESVVLSRVNRPGCFINMIAAGGLVLLPESSSGCTCGYPVQASFTFRPLSIGR